MLSSRVLALVTLALFPVSGAQSAAELLTATSISSTLDSALTVRLPSGTSFVSNAKYAGNLAPGLLGAQAGQFAEYKLYTARGLAVRLADSYVADLKTSFAASGFFEAASRTLRVGGDTWTRTDFQNDAGRALALFVTKRADGVYFLTATGK